MHHGERPMSTSRSSAWLAPGEHRVIALLVTAALVFRLALAWVIPPFQAPDEQAHFRFVEYMAEHSALPVQPARDLQRDLEFWPQYYQPPLAYLLFLPVERALAAAGLERESRLRGVRAANAVIGATGVALAYLASARLTPIGDPRRVLVGVVIALVPGIAGNAATVDNDALANLLAIALWIPLLSPNRRRGAWIAGVIFGAACNAKLTVLALSPLLLLVPWLSRREDPRGALRFAVIAGGVAGLTLLPWLIRNYLVYGDPLAIGVGSMSFEWLSKVIPPEKVAELQQLRILHAWNVFWGRFGVYHNLGWIPIPVIWTALSAAAVAGWIRARGAPDGLESTGIVMLAASLLAAAGLTWFSIRYYGGWQGRYVYTAMLPIAVLLACGWIRMLPDRRVWSATWILASGLVVLDVALVLALSRFWSVTPPLRWGFATWI
jgi:hypothetical protein